jgi:osmotically inducible lipoprotein OsmB
MKTIKTIGIIVIATGLSACAGMSHTEKDTLVGAGTGAVAGSIISGGNPSAWSAAQLPAASSATRSARTRTAAIAAEVAVFC